jgi:hypothetical protein
MITLYHTAPKVYGELLFLSKKLFCDDSHIIAGTINPIIDTRK